MTDADVKKIKSQSKELNGGTRNADIVIALINAEAINSLARAIERSSDTLAEGMRRIGK